jgi:hypothetical protein
MTMLQFGLVDCRDRGSHSYWDSETELLATYKYVQMVCPIRVSAADRYSQGDASIENLKG